MNLWMSHLNLRASHFEMGPPEVQMWDAQRFIWDTYRFNVGHPEVEHWLSISEVFLKYLMKEKELKPGSFTVGL